MVLVLQGDINNSRSTKQLNYFLYTQQNTFSCSYSYQEKIGIIMLISPAIFRAYDIRGIVRETLTSEAAYKIGQAFGTEAVLSNHKRIVIGRDGRLSSPELSLALAEGVAVTGCDIIDIGIVPTPVLYFATHQLNTGTGIMITGSHNPPEYNGMKMMLGGETLYGDKIQALRERIERQDFGSGQGEFSTIDIRQDYITRIIKDITLKRSLRIAIDCGNGAASEVAVNLFKQMGLNIVELFCVIDGTFPNHHPNPSEEKNLEDLRTVVREQKLDLGLAFDGDGDRLGVIDSKGKIIWPDRQMILFARDILDRNPAATTIFDVKCSIHLKTAIIAAGGKAIMSKTGHSLIKARMQETGALLAGEMSGHIFFKERWYGFDDGLYAAARLLEILTHTSNTPDEIFAELPDSVNTPELNIRFDEGQHYVFMQQFQKQAQFQGAQITDIDGIRADYNDGWGLIRASNTTPALVLRFEADNESALARIQAEFKTQILQINNTLKMPF